MLLLCNCLHRVLQQEIDVRQLETHNGSPDEFERVVTMATGRRTGEVLINKGALLGSVYSGSIYWRRTSSAHYFITPITGILLVSCPPFPLTTE